MVDATVLASLYEAGGSPEKWPDMLDIIAGSVGARGGIIFSATDGAGFHMASPGVAELFADYVAQGWMERNERGAPLVRQRSPQFVTDTDVRSLDDIATMPVYQEFFKPRGACAGAGTLLQGAHHDMLVMTIEAFESHQAARVALPHLDALRPHIGRAMSLASQIRNARAQGLVDGLALIGSAAAIVGANGRLRATNQAFRDQFGSLASDHHATLCFADPHANAALKTALSMPGRLRHQAGSIVVRDRAGTPIQVMHIVPLVRSARDLFESDGLLLLTAGGENRAIPGADLLRLLFDLTPTEARLARHLAEGVALQDAAAHLGVTYGTARVHLRAVFQKTGVRRQSDLVGLLGRYGSPFA